MLSKLAKSRLQIGRAIERTIEAVAKLLCPEKSMILSYVASGSKAATVHSTRSTPSGLAEENGRNVAQKGDFNGQSSFAIASIVSRHLKQFCAEEKSAPNHFFRLSP